MRSTGDKAYLQPGTSEGLANARNQKIITITDDEKGKMLPKYDWPAKLAYQTPGAHRIFVKESSIFDERETEKLVTKEGNHLVFIRPKVIINSNGSTLAIETVRLGVHHLDEFEVKGNDMHSKQFRKVCGAIHYACFLYADMTEHDYISKIRAQNDYIYEIMNENGFCM